MSLPQNDKPRTVALRCHCGAEHQVDVGQYRDPRGELVELRAGWMGRSGSTLVRAARAGELRAFEVERQTLVAWEADLRTWVERKPAARPQEMPPPSNDNDYMPPGLRRGA